MSMPEPTCSPFAASPPNYSPPAAMQCPMYCISEGSQTEHSSSPTPSRSEGNSGKRVSLVRLVGLVGLACFALVVMGVGASGTAATWGSWQVTILLRVHGGFSATGAVSMAIAVAGAASSTHFSLADGANLPSTSFQGTEDSWAAGTGILRTCVPFALFTPASTQTTAFTPTAKFVAPAVFTGTLETALASAVQLKL